MMLDKLNGAISCLFFCDFYHFKTSSIYVSRLSECCNAFFCCGAPEMLCGLRNFPSAWGREDNDQVFNFRQTYPLMLCLSWDCYSPRGGCNNATIIKNVYLTDRHRCLWGNGRNTLYPRPMKKTLRWLSKQTTTLGGVQSPPVVTVTGRGGL